MDSSTVGQFSQRRPKLILGIVLIIALTVIVSLSILRDRFVNQPQWQVSAVGHAVVPYYPDKATGILGVQIDQAANAQTALEQLTDKTDKIIAAVKKIGIADADITTQSFSILTHYDYLEGGSQVSGYDASQQLAIKLTGLTSSDSRVSQVITTATTAGANRIDGIIFDVANLEELKQQARLTAIADAKQKATALADAAGVKLKKVVGWWDNVIQAPGLGQPYYYADGKGGLGGGTAAGSVPSGLQEIIIDVSVNYQIK